MKQFKFLFKQVFSFLYILIREKSFGDKKTNAWIIRHIPDRNLFEKGAKIRMGLNSYANPSLPPSPISVSDHLSNLLPDI